MHGKLKNIVSGEKCRKLVACLLESEERLMNTVLDYAVRHNFSKYTSTLKEAWRISISGLNKSIINALENHNLLLELGPDQDFRSDPIASFAIIEAKRHRERGIRLEMFLGLLKYYRQSYHDVIQADPGLSAREKEVSCYVISRLFDRMEIGFCAEWSTPGSMYLDELQTSNRTITTEKNKFLTIFESISFPLILLNTDLQIDNLNHAAAMLLGGNTVPGAHYYASKCEPASWCGGETSAGPFLPVLPEWLIEEIKIFTSKKDSQKYSFQKEVLTAGARKIYTIQLSKMMDFSGKFSGTVVMIQDLTDSRMAEEERSRMKEQLLQSDRMASVGQLAAGVAHEINNPLGFVVSNLNRLEEYAQDLIGLIGNYSQFAAAVEANAWGAKELKSSLSRLRESEADADLAFLSTDVRTLIKESQEGADRVRQIVADLKDFAHPGISTPQFADINRCLESTVNVLGNEIKKKSTLTKNFGEIPEILCHPCQLNQAFMNIIANAAQAIEKNGEICITTRQKGRCVQVLISDSGCGIAPENINRIFEPFFTTNPVGAGTGLGLHLAYQIIQQHRGHILVTSQPGQGTTFAIDLPITLSGDEVGS
jgi:signal transduction histidine kinase